MTPRTSRTPGSKRHSCSLILLRSIILLGPTIFLKVTDLLIVNMIVSYCARWRKVMLSTINFLWHNVQDAAATRPSMSRHVRRLKRNVVFHTVLAHNLSRCAAAGSSFGNGRCSQHSISSQWANFHVSHVVVVVCCVLFLLIFS